MVERYAIFLNGEQISPSFKTGDEASRWGAERYDVADDRVSIGVVYEDDIEHVINHTVADKNKCALIKELLGKTGKYAYDKYGLNRDEAITETIKYDCYVIDVRLVIPYELEDEVWTEAILYEVVDDESEELVTKTFTEPAEEFFGEWRFELDDNEFIILNVKERE